MKIQIPEMEKLDTNSINLLKIMLCEIDFYIENLSVKYKLNTINDINGYKITFISKLLKTFQTLILISEDANDYVAANAITRVIVDNVSVFKFIYCNSNNEELILRHYLYILDGCTQRYKMLPEQIVNDGRITDKEFNFLSKQIRNTKENEKCNIDFILSELDRHPLKKLNNKAFEQIVEKKMWKYKKMQYCKNIKDNIYTWQELYEFLDMSNMKVYFSYLSNYIHGLSISNILLEDDRDNFEPINNIVIVLLGELRKSIISLFKIEIEECKKNFFNSEQFETMFCLFGPKYREELIQQFSALNNEN